MNKNTFSPSNIRKAIMIVMLSMVLLTSACTKTLGGHSITVNMPKNDCGNVACTTETQTDILIVK